MVANTAETYKATHPLWQHVLEVYDKAQQTGAATKTDTKVEVLADSNVEFVLRLASALKSKPKGLSGSRWVCTDAHNHSVMPTVCHNVRMPSSLCSSCCRTCDALQGRTKEQ